MGQDPHGRGDIPKAVDQFVGFEQRHRCKAGTEPSKMWTDVKGRNDQDAPLRLRNDVTAGAAAVT